MRANQCPSCGKAVAPDESGYSFGPLTMCQKCSDEEPMSQSTALAGVLAMIESGQPPRKRLEVKP